MTKPKVDPDKCSGCGTCAVLCPAVFQLNEDGLSEVIKKDKYDQPCIQDAIENCPPQAISR